MADTGPESGDNGEPPIRAVIDCDPGHDDALALLAALGSPTLQVDFVTTVAGNAPIEQVTANALGVLALAGVGNVPVYKGSAGPMARDLAANSCAHGASGLEGPPLPEPLQPPVGPALPRLSEWCAETSGRQKRLICIGPLTNIGKLLESNSDALKGVVEIFVMGGSLSGTGGRLSPTAETNFYIDPEAADIVLRSGIPMRLYDYDVTTSCLISAGDIDRIEHAVPGDVGRYTAAWLRYQYEFGRTVYGRDGVPAHDLYAVAGAAGLEPDRWERYQLGVDTTAERRGMIIADSGGQHAIARGLNPAAMVAFFTSSAVRLPAVRRR